MGTDESFEAWYAWQHPRLLATITLAAGDADLAREVTDETFVRSLERWSRVSAMDSPGGWAYRVAINLLRRRQRRAALERRLWLERAPAGHAPPADIDIDLWQAVRALPARQREAIALRYLSGLTEEEVASAMGVARGTASASLHAGRRQLAAVLGGDHG